MESGVLQGVTLACVLTAIAAMIYAFGSITRAIDNGFRAKQQTDELFAMADMLQSAADQADTNEVLRAAAANLVPGFSGALYVFNNSRDRLDLSTQWGALAESSSDHIGPDSCWALKRGKPHLNRADAGALRCAHAHDGLVVLEIPMAARGQLYGLLEIIADGADAPERLRQVQPVAMAMGDAMSLALSNIALRERLRNQALRDSLTGLYNRRFLEEMLERICQDAERRKAPVSAIMIDLDHFKQINDKYGHGAGDAILRDVAATIMASLRSVDVACRYGGEELAILLPDCTLEMAAGKAEQIRSRIASTSGAAGPSVTASLGVASIPETSSGPVDLLPIADAALYQAKQQGRDRVVTATVRRPAGQKLSLIEPAPQDRAAARDETA
jgi:diguanylate cyclase (GGDEF)-like protein